MPGNCQGRHAKEVKFESSRELAELRGKGDERTGRGVRWAAVSCQRVNPATVRDIAEGLGPQGLPSGIRLSAPCRRPTADHVPNFCAAPSWAHPYKGRRICGFVQAIFGGFLSISPRSQKTSVFWGVPIVDSIPGITCIIRIIGGH